MTEPTRRNKLNEKQLRTLEILYRFRFVTTDLLSRLQTGKSKTSVYSRLRILADQGYIGRDYDGKRQIRGEYATYYLLRPGINALKKHMGDKFSAKAEKNLARDANASEQFRAHCLRLLRFYCDLTDNYPDADFYTRNELMAEQYNYFPKPLPDAYVTTDTAHFFVDVFDSTSFFFKLTRRVKTYVAYHDSKDWDATRTNFPAVLLICASPADQKRLQNKLPFMAKNTNFYTIVANDLEAVSKDAPIFTSVNGQVSLADIMVSAQI